MKLRDGDIYEFASGNTMYANNGIIGIGPDLALHEGYDGGIHWPPDEYDETKLTREDMLELADAMIERWQQFKRSVQLP